MKPRSMPPWTVRCLTSAEVDLAASVFGVALDVSRVRILAIPFWRRAFAAGGSLIVWPARFAPGDFGTARPSAQSELIHELTHAWQARIGVNLILAKLRAGDGPGAYDYALAGDSDFGSFNIEQQAMILQHAFLAARSQPAPFPAERYAAVLANTPFAGALSPLAA